MAFSEFHLHPNLLRAVSDLGFEAPTPIQRMSIPPLMEGRDVLAAAATGSGKTAAFLLPILHKLMEKPRGVTRALVLAPTRELAAQIADHLKALAAHTHIKGAAVYGGVGMEPQVKAFQRGVDVIVATPGRLLDHFQYPYAKLDALEYLVLDEADRMLDMGFLPDVRRILKTLPRNRQTFLFSATLPQPIVELAGEMLKDAVRLNVERKAAPAVGITHEAYPVPHELKSHLLLELLKRPEATSVLAFTRTKHRANRLADFLLKRGVPCARIHGNRSQLQRTEALAGFKAGDHRVLVATDIAARGIDVEALGLVVNFDVPNLPEDYIHRVGRTARAELTGHAFTLIAPDEEPDFRTIEAHVGTRIPRRKVEGFDYAHKPQEKLEVPIAERIAAIRARKAEERARSKAKAEAKAGRTPAGAIGRAPKGEAKPPASREAGHASTSRGAHPSKGRGPDRRNSPDRHPRHREPQQKDGGRPRAPEAKAASEPRKDAPKIDSRKREGNRPERPSPRRDDGSRNREGRDQGRGNAPEKQPARSSFIRSSQRPEWDPRVQPSTTSGVRQEAPRSHKDGLAGRSPWGKAWREQGEKQAPVESRPEN